MPKLGDYLNAINWSKEDLFESEDPSVEKEYPPYIINRTLSLFPDTILLVNELNQRAFLDKKLQFQFLLNTVRKRKRFSKWLQKPKMEKIDSIKTFYGYNTKKAMDVLDILSDKQIEEIELKLGEMK